MLEPLQRLSLRSEGSASSVASHSRFICLVADRLVFGHVCRPMIYKDYKANLRHDKKLKLIIVIEALGGECAHLLMVCHVPIGSPCMQLEEPGLWRLAAWWQREHGADSY